ncbi:MAG TPA: hypothetical protein VNF49_05700, partial [Candidatus Binataceae bacterium]|nr:hypothetical protein [Candidatus Binataceae bacterium]
MSAVAATAKRALGPRVRYLSSAWQNLIAVGNRSEQLKALGLPAGFGAGLGPSAPSAPQAAGRFGAVSAPPDLTATRFSTFTTSETSTAWCGRNVVVGFNDTGSLTETSLTEGSSTVGYSHSGDAGTSFNDMGTLPPFSDPNFIMVGDPVAKCTAGKNFFLSSIYSDCTGTELGICVAGNNGVSVSASTDGGATFSAPVPVVTKDFTTDLVDKDW